MGTKPSDELADLFRVSWRRGYTFNVDDTIESIPKYRLQQALRTINAQRSRVEEWNGFHQLQLIHLHGYSKEFEAGFTFSDTEYAASAAHLPPWYKKLAADFVEYTVIFLGTSLDEHLLFQAIQQTTSDGTNPGTSYSITPSPLSEIKRQALRNRGIVHIEATVTQFVAALRSDFPRGLSVSDIDTGSASSGADASQLSREDIDALMSLRPLARSATASPGATRRFYEGFGPSQAVIGARAYAMLSKYQELRVEATAKLDKHRCLVVLGQAGSGKSTFAMHLAFSIADVRTPVFEFTRGSAGLLPTVRALKKHVKETLAYVLLDDLQLYHEDVAELIANPALENVRFITSIRSSEWHDRVHRTLDSRSATVTLDRFGRADIPIIIEAIKKNFAAPAFIRLPADQQRKRFEQSDRQLLIAMLEATKGHGFDQIIEDEFDGLQEFDRRTLFLLAAYATLARVGIEKAAALTVMKQLQIARSFDDVISSLNGIVDQANSSRYFARHEIYAREVIYRHGAFEEIEAVITQLVHYFADFSMPIIKHVSKVDGQLFKYVLNNKNVYDLYKTAHMQQKSPRFFAQFEVALQLDGHFWLQFGLLLRRCEQHTEALAKLEKSIEAYPENAFARHALAQQELIVAAQPGLNRATALKLIEKAVSSLLERHHIQGDFRMDETGDEYPIVALGNYHVDALVSLGDEDGARSAAKRYFNEIQKLKGRDSDHFLRDLSRKLLLLGTTGTWERLHYKIGNISYL